MYTVLYRWDIHPEKRDDFIFAWEAVTKHYMENYDALGSRLHEISDNTFAAYAQWPSKESRDSAFDENTAPAEAREKMTRSIIKRYEPIEMTVLLDHLLPMPGA